MRWTLSIFVYALFAFGACGAPTDCELYAKEAVGCTQKHIDDVELNNLPGFFTVERAELMCESWLRRNDRRAWMQAEIECVRQLDDCRALTACVWKASDLHNPDSCRNSPKPWCPKSR